MADDVRVPAGWYPDPLGLPQLRWWDNHAWTEYTSDARQPMVAETVAQQPRLAFADDDEDQLTRRERRERERETETVVAEQPLADAGGVREPAEPAKPVAEALLALEAPVREEVVEDELSPAAKFADFVPVNAPAGPAYNLETRFDDLLGDSLAAQGLGLGGAANETTGSTSTPGAWIMAMIPLGALVLTMFFLLANMSDSLAGVAPLILGALSLVAGVVLAYLDWAALRRKGYTDIAHWAWAIATPPVYLLLRFLRLVRVTGRGFGPLVTIVALSVLNIFAVGAVPGLLISMNPPTFSAQAEDTVVNQARALALDISVDCPSSPPTIVGQSFTCIAQTNDDAPVQWGIPVSLQRSSVWFEWRIDNWGIVEANVGG